MIEKNIWFINFLFIALIVSFSVILIFLLIEFFLSDSEWSKIDSCLDRGYCWDYNRNRCEKKNQGYCIKNQKRCDEVSGFWNEEEKYCKLPF